MERCLACEADAVGTIRPKHSGGHRTRPWCAAYRMRNYFD